MMGAAGGGELAALIANLKNPEVIQDQLKDLDRRRDLAGQAEAAAKTAQAEADEALRKSEAAAKSAADALALREAAASEREKQIEALETSVAERERRLEAEEKTILVKLAEADGREKDTTRGSVDLQARAAQQGAKEAAVAARESIIGDFLKEIANLQKALELNGRG